MTVSSRLISAAALCAMAACSSEVAVPAPGAQEAPQVAVVTLKADAFPLRTELAGRVSAVRVSEVRPQVAGIIEKRLFEEGANVKAGQLLYQINDDSFQARVAQANAELAMEKAALVNLRILAERYRTLVKTQHVTQQDHDLAQANYAQGEARVTSREATVKLAQIDLARTKVRAPIGGRIGRSTVTEGALVSVDQGTALTIIQQVDPVYVDVVQASAQLTQLKQQLGTAAPQSEKAQVTLALEGGQAYAHAGVLKFTEMQVDADAGVVMLRAQFPNPGAVLMPGMYVRATVEQGILPGVVLLPQQAVRYNDKNEASAWVVGPGDVVEARVVKLLGSHADQWAAMEGVRAGERVVVEGAMKVRPGLKVTPVAWTVAAAAKAQAVRTE